MTPYANQPTVDVARDPNDLPGPLAAPGPQRVNINLESVEVIGRLANGATRHS
jgi:nitrite reductase (NO-forming)